MRPAPFSSADLLDSGHHDQARAAELATGHHHRTTLKAAADQPQRGPCASFSTRPQPHVEKAAHACGTVHLYRLTGGRLRAQRLDCKTKACPRCGPRLRATYAAGYAAVLAAAGPLYRLQLPDTGWRRLQTRLRRAGAQVLRIPSPAGQLTIYTTGDVAVDDLVDDQVDVAADELAELLAADFAAMPTDRRNVSASTGWRAGFHTWQDDQQPQPTSDQGERLGILCRPLEHVAMIARELGMLEREAANSLLLRDPPDPDTWRRFCALARLRTPAP